MEKEPTQETHPEESLENSAGGDEAVTEKAVDPLTVINEITGRDYKDLDTATESLKEMQKEASSVGNLKKENETLKNTPQTDEELRTKVAELTQQVNQNATESFFSANKDHEVNRSIIEKIAKADGISITEAVNTAEYKSIYDAQQTAGIAESKRTVAGSNARVASPAKDEEAPKPGDKRAAGEFVANKYFKKD